MALNPTLLVSALVSYDGKYRPRHMGTPVLCEKDMQNYSLIDFSCFDVAGGTANIITADVPAASPVAQAAVTGTRWGMISPK